MSRRKSVIVMVIIQYSPLPMYLCYTASPVSVTLKCSPQKRTVMSPLSGDILVLSGHNPKKKKKKEKHVGGPCSLDLLIVFNFQQDYSCITALLRILTFSS